MAMKEFKIPAIILPTDEEMKLSALKWWADNKHIDMRSWNTILKDNSFPFYTFDIPQHIMDSIVEYEEPKNRVGAYKLTDDYFAPILKEIGLYDRYFMKLCTRSPKDALYDESNYGKPSALSGTSGIVDTTRSSMRTFDDMCLLRYIPEYAYIVFRPYIDFHPSTEWRVFIYNGSIFGISQYYYEATFDNYTDDHIHRVRNLIRDFHHKVMLHNMPLESYIFDVVCDGKNVTLLEVNPWGTSDPCLFRDYKSWDGSIKYNPINP